MKNYSPSHKDTAPAAIAASPPRATAPCVLRMVAAGLLARVAGGRGLFSPARPYANGAAQSLLVLSPGEIPTTALYLGLRLEEHDGTARWGVIDTLRTAPAAATLPPHPMVVVVRYAPLAWLRWLEDNQSLLAGVAYLMDDDIPAAVLAEELPFFYALKTSFRFALVRRHLQRLCSEVWLSTPELVRRYPEATPRLLEPQFIDRKTVPAPAPQKVYFYHGSWAHRREIEWLVPVVRAVQATVPDAWFEIIGTNKVARMFRGIPRVRVIPPLTWPDYLRYAESISYAVGLAPCFDTPFNRARSHCKVFDIARAGAAGVYSDVTPYREQIAHRKTGLLCANVETEWIEAIVLLLNDPALRNDIYRNALARCRLSSQPFSPAISAREVFP